MLSESSLPLLKKDLERLESEIEKSLPSKPEKVYEMLVPYIRRGGKRIRPVLSILTCLAFGGASKDVLKPALIIELFHNFTLIHDDIEDNSLMRRGEPTLHIIYGVPIALNSGDALYTAIWQNIVDLSLPANEFLELQKMYVSTFRGVVEGQGIELSWYNDCRFDISEEDYFSMITGKTACLIGLSCKVGAFVAKCDKKMQDNMKKFGEYLGIAFQIQDDVLNLVGDVKKYKKEIGGDITEGKRTLMVIHALKRANASDKEFLVSCLKNHEVDEKNIKKCIDVLVKHRSIEYAKEKAVMFVKKARDCLDSVPESVFREELGKMCEFIVSRES
ncbi:MAG: polyprenyl synthetase family protein [Candidatus Micrarchaeota archaeon]